MGANHKITSQGGLDELTILLCSTAAMRFKQKGSAATSKH